MISTGTLLSPCWCIHIKTFLETNISETCLSFLFTKETYLQGNYVFKKKEKKKKEINFHFEKYNKFNTIALNNLTKFQINH